jgi:hypothetical protein
MQAGQCGNQMGTKFLEVVRRARHLRRRRALRDNAAQLDRIDMLYHEVSRGKYMPRAMLFGLEPGVIGGL